MLRVLLFALFAYGVMTLIRGALAPPAAPPQRRVTRAERMVRCTHCGLFVPESEALHDGEQHYCSEGHRAAQRARRSAP
ncbi:MAG: hypothetical protein B7Z66_01420 [Chromatiales bacterium 21-64-14]|nr:MAG: hypothetical protein B7Z66_01420 [Chromatiales bacterium 21-64-14]HQU14873.1 PP0621 family protein [Gammaproteobacteria bacterium]